MNKNRINSLFNGLVASILLISSCKSPSPKAQTDSDNQYIKDLFAASEEAWNQGKREEYIIRYAPDAIFMVPNMEPLIGKDAIRAFINSFPEIKVSFSIKEILGSDDYAYVRGTYTLTNPADTLVDKGKFLNVFKKNPDGQWQVIRDIFNSDLPVSVAKD